MSNGRAAFLDLSKKLKVSNATIHGRYKKLIEGGFIKGIHAQVDPKLLGFGLHAFVGIQIQQASQHDSVVSAVKKLSEVLEVHYTTGRYSLLTKIVAKDMDDLFLFMSKKLQVIPSITSTETFLVLHSYFDREMDASKLTRNSRTKYSLGD
jgi:Lrp/AsnC family transcriptional regulator for asnA, asnC and gidA